MSESTSTIGVRTLGTDDWQTYRQVRLAALEDSPEAFVATADQEQGYDDERWQERMVRSKRILATRDGQTVGVVSLGRTASPDDDQQVGEIFGLWVTPAARGTGVATALINASAVAARDNGDTHVLYWVGTDNGRAVAFASGIGFRPTDFRRPMSTTGDEELAMILPVADLV